MTSLVEVLVEIASRAHGIHGGALVDVRTDEPGRRLQPRFGFRLTSGGELVLERIRWCRGELVVSFQGYPDRTAVETLRGKHLFIDVPADETPSKPKEYFGRQLIGFRALDAKGRRTGEAAEVLHLPAQDCLTAETSSGRHLVPFVSALVTRVNLTTGRVQFADVDGLLEESE